MPDWKGFWSYVHADDDAERGRISTLARDIVAQFEMLTGERVELFLDKDAIQWGDAWRQTIDEGLATVAFFISVLSPRYFMSAECRRELQFFVRRATDLGVKELVLPLLYVDVAALHEQEPADDLVALVRTFQWEDWRELRFAAVDSEEYRRSVARLASQLVSANERASEADVVTRIREIEGVPEVEGEESPGVLDRLADAEDAVPMWTATIEAIGREVELIGQLMTAATEDMEKADARGKGFAGRLAVTRRVSQELREPADKVWMLGNEFASQLHQVDGGVRVIIEQAGAEAEQDPESLAAVCEFFETLRTLSHSTHEGLESTRGMIESTTPLEKMSRDLRPPLRRLKQGLTTMLEAQEVTDEWLRLMDETGLECNKS